MLVRRRIKFPYSMSASMAAAAGRGTGGGGEGGEQELFRAGPQELGEPRERDTHHETAQELRVCRTTGACTGEDEAPVVL